MSAARCDDGAAPPRYQRIAGDLLEAIRGGRLRVGDELPSEHALCGAYGVSRSTVRQAFRRLQLQGLISRQQGAISRVVATQMPGFRLVLGSPGETQEYARNNCVDFRPMRRSVALRRAAELDLPDPGSFDAASGLRWEKGAGLPVALTTVFVRRPYSEVLDAAGDAAPLVLFSPICSSYGLSLTHVDETTSGIRISPQVALRLGCEPGMAGLRVVHRFFAEAVGLFEVSDEIHPADRFALSHRFLALPGAGTGATAG